ncbi:MAG: Spy/CpxP family protein refolding chaperone [Acidobacteria bacterium]|nr:Spy/CpxP family protein refolding chaperone [Acidobacteriota bacterium]
MNFKQSVAIATVSAALATLAVAAPAQASDKKTQRNFDALKSYLSLSDSQVTAIQEARKAQREQMKAEFPQLQAKHKAMQDALQSGTADATTLGNMLLDTQAARKKVQAERQAAHEQLLSTLTPDQKTKLDELKGKRGDAAARQAMRLGLLMPDRANASGAAKGFRRGGRGSAGAMGFRRGEGSAGTVQKF